MNISWRGKDLLIYVFLGEQVVRVCCRGEQAVGVAQICQKDRSGNEERKNGRKATKAHYSIPSVPAERLQEPRSSCSSLLWVSGHLKCNGGARGGLSVQQCAGTFKDLQHFPASCRKHPGNPGPFCSGILMWEQPAAFPQSHQDGGEALGLSITFQRKLCK